MSGMAEVLLIHSPIGRDENGQYCKGCNHPYGYAAERTLHQRACDHIAAMLTAAGFGPVKEAGAVALEEAAREMREERRMWCLDDAARYWIKRTLDDLEERAAAVRGEG